MSISVTPEQYNNWVDFRHVEELLPAGTNLPVWRGVDILRARRAGLTYEQIMLKTNSSFNHVRLVCQAEKKYNIRE